MRFHFLRAFVLSMHAARRIDERGAQVWMAGFHPFAGWNAALWRATNGRRDA